MRCGRASCRQVFVIRKSGPVREGEEIAGVEADPSTIQPFSPDDCDVSFEVDAAMADLPSEFTVVSGLYQGRAAGGRRPRAEKADAGFTPPPSRTWGDSSSECTGCQETGDETPSWATDLSVDDARAIAAKFDQTFVYLVRHGAMAIVSCGGSRALSSFGAGIESARGRSRSLMFSSFVEWVERLLRSPKEPYRSRPDGLLRLDADGAPRRAEALREGPSGRSHEYAARRLELSRPSGTRDPADLRGRGSARPEGHEGQLRSAAAEHRTAVAIAAGRSRSTPFNPRPLARFGQSWLERAATFVVSNGAVEILMRP